MGTRNSTRNRSISFEMGNVGWVWLLKCKFLKQISGVKEDAQWRGGDLAKNETHHPRDLHLIGGKMDFVENLFGMLEIGFMDLA